MTKDDVYIVIPGLNEAKTLKKVLLGIKKYTKNIIYIDDGSTDDSVKIAKKHIQHVLVHQINLGNGAALKTGCDYAFKHLNAQAVILMDADDQHNPNEIPEFFKRLQYNDIVLGIRGKGYLTKAPLIRIISNKLLSTFFLILFSKFIPDIPCGYKAFTKKIYPKISWQSSDYSVELEIAAKIAKYKLPFTTLEVETIYHSLDRGMNFINSIKVLLKLIYFRSFCNWISCY